MSRPLSVRERTAALLGELNDDECLPVLRLVTRLVMGRKEYGALDLNTNHRDMLVELQNEALDFISYSEWEIERRRRAGERE